MIPRILLSAACLACFQLCCLAQDVQARAGAMMERARQLSDIRSSGSPAFRLRAAFSFVGDHLETVQGTYTEVWVSNSQWRRETVINNIRRTEVGGPARRWLLDSNTNFSETAERLPELMEAVHSDATNLKFESIEEHPDTNPPSECAVTKPNAEHLRTAFCFDKNKGLLLERVYPQERMRQSQLRNIVDYSCDFAIFHQFGEHLFPSEIACFVDRHKDIVATVELSVAQTPDPTLFVAPAGAIELGRCSGTLDPPRWVSWGLGVTSHNDASHTSWATIWFVVDVKGRAQNGRVIRSPDRARDEQVLNKIRLWSFQPATCNGEPMPVPLTVDIPLATR